MAPGYASTRGNQPRETGGERKLGSEEEIGPDVSPVRWSRWLTPRNLIIFTLLWIVLFSIGSLFVSNPFQSEVSAGADPIFWHVMYLHSLLISLVGLLALVACQVLSLRSAHTRVFVVVGVIVATVATGIGGIFDRRVPGAEVAMWTQIIGFFALDEILLVLLAGMVGEWRRRSAAARSLALLTAMAATASMFVAAIMGHLAGWILEFGDRPAVLGGYASAVGYKIDDWTASLIGSHSHDMVVAVMALIVALAAVQFAGQPLTRGARAVVRVGLGLVCFGIVVTTIMYVAMGFTTWAPPTLFQSAGGTNGIAGDDIVTGVFIMFGGLLTVFGLLLGRGSVVRPYITRLAGAWAWFLSFAMVVVAGYAIEMNETFFGAGDKAPGATKDAVFTWLHQDIGLFLFPAVALLMVAVERLVAQRYLKLISWNTIVGTTLTFLGGIVFVFVDPALHGAGFVISTIGLIFIGGTFVSALWAMARSASAAVSVLAEERLIPVDVTVTDGRRGTSS